MGQEDDMIRKGPWTEHEDVQLVFYVNMFGDRRWDFIAKVSGLKRTGKSCRLRWVNYLHPGLKRGKMTPNEERLVLELHSKWGNRWSRIARKLPGRTDNEIKNYWRTHMRKKAQEKKRAASPESSSLSNSSSSSSICTSNPTVDSMPVSETKKRSFYDSRGIEIKERSFYDTGGIEMVAVAKSNNTKSTTTTTSASVNKTNDGQEGYYSMDEIWKDIDLLEDDDGIKPVSYDQYSEIAVSPIWDFSFDSLWMMDGNGETGSSMFFPTPSDQFSAQLTG